jgi:hypothetical protein
MLEVLLASWERNNTILLNLLRSEHEGALEARAMEGSPSTSELFTHIHFVRLVFVLEDAPEFARTLPENQWAVERNRGRIAEMGQCAVGNRTTGRRLTKTAQLILDNILPTNRQQRCAADNTLSLRNGERQSAIHRCAPRSA